MDAKNLASLSEIRTKLCQKYYEARDYTGVINCLGKPAKPEERELIARCHYELAKRDSLFERFGEVKSHAVAVEQLNPTSDSVRSLNAARLKILNKRHLVTSKAVHCTPGTVFVNGIGKVVVLDKYVTYGYKTEITKIVLFLKKAPQEMEVGEIDTRPQLIQDLGSALWNVLRRLDFTTDIDMLVPIPPDPERFSIRMYQAPQAIAEAISNQSTIPLEDNLLHKIRETQSIRGMSGQDRANEIVGSMEVNPHREFVVKDRCVLLVDDVVTYGTHFREVKRILTQAGAREVYACSLAAAHGDITPL